MALTTITKWPGIRVTQSDRLIIKRVQEYNGILKNVPMKDLLLIAASLALKHRLPSIESDEPLSADIVNPALMAKPEYADYIQYIAMIFYFTGAEKDLANMSDKTIMIRNFVDYAQRGLRMLENNYLNDSKGSEALVNDFIERLQESQ